MPKQLGTNRLTSLECESARGPVILEDGGGLRLVVAPTGARKWVLRISVSGKRHDFGLGSFETITLKAARTRAFDMRRNVEAGEIIEPTPRTKARHILVTPTNPDAITVKECFREFWRMKKPQLGNGKHVGQWTSTLERYVFPYIGSRPVSDVTTRDIATALEPIWREIPVTAGRIKERLKAIFDFAIASGYRSAGNPVLPVKMILGEQGHTATHHRALPYTEIPFFLNQLRERQSRGSSELAFEWLILTATRSSETRCALAAEVGINQRVWTIPAERMKMRREHRVPLSSRCIAIYEETRRRWPNSRFLFPSSAGRKPHLSENTFQVAIESLNLGDRATAHGMRSSFRDWAAECAKAREVVAEACLAHLPKDKVVAAYRRTSFFEERRGLMEEWAGFCGTTVSR